MAKSGGGAAVNKEAALGKKPGADGGASKDKITENNKIKKQKQEAKAKDVNVKIEACMQYLIT